MARGFYRVYLYTVFGGMLIFVAVATSSFLGTLLSLTSLRGVYASPPSQPVLVQAGVLAFVSWVVAGILGGLHYWLIQRDLRTDPTAATSGIRAFFLNILEALFWLSAIGALGLGVIDSWARFNGADVTGSAAIGLTLLALATLLELERRRTPLHRGVALVFQRLHFFGVQATLLSYVALTFFNDLSLIVHALFYKSVGCGEFCPAYNLPVLGLSPLWFVVCWLVYSLVTREDTSRNVRMILHSASLAFGIGYTLDGVYLFLETALQAPFHLSSPDFDALAFVTPLLLGLLTTFIYHLLLQSASRRGLLETRVRWLVEWVIAGLLLAVVFWWGIGLVLYNLLQGQAVVSGMDWVEALALLITGVGYMPLEIFLRWRYQTNLEHAQGPRRGFVFGLLGSGALVLALGGAAALYAWLTSLIGSPLGNGAQIIHGGLAATIVGVMLVALYLWTARGEQLFARSATPQPEQPPVPVTPTPSVSVEEVLDKLLAGKIDRVEAAKRIREMEHVTPKVAAF